MPDRVSDDAPGAAAARTLHPGVAWATIALWLARHRRRKTLAAIAALGERTMLDLGFDPDDVWAEATKPFWRP